MVVAEPIGTSEPPYVDVLIGAWPHIRNRFAHPEMHTIKPPGMSVGGTVKH